MVKDILLDNTLPITARSNFGFTHKGAEASVNLLQPLSPQLHM